MYKYIMKLWYEGKTSKEIEALTGVDEKTIINYVKKCKYPRSYFVNSSNNSYEELKLGQPGRKSIIPHNKFVNLWKTGMLIEDMATELGTTPANVKIYAARHRADCPPRGSGRRPKVR